MGLDMFLHKVKRDEVAYWRKANEIHAWFERRLTDGEGIENCKDYYVSKEDLIDLRDTCLKVLAKCKVTDGMVKNGERLVGDEWQPIYEPGKVITNPEYAEELMPRQDGFFFGDVEYDQYYLDDLENTIEQIDKILETVDFEKDDIYYHAWW